MKIEDMFDLSESRFDKYNPYHDERGRFTTGPSSGGGRSTRTKGKLVDYMSRHILAALREPDRKKYVGFFDAVYPALRSKQWPARDVIEVARRVTGEKTKTKKAAIAAILDKQHFLQYESDVDRHSGRATPW